MVVSSTVERGTDDTKVSEHPGVNNVHHADAATRKYRKRSLPGPDINARDALEDAVVIVPLQPVTPSPSVLTASEPTATDSLAISQDGNDFSYFSEVRIGSSQKEFLLVIDTGSADTWIPSASCRSPACGTQVTFSSADSSTLNTTDEEFDILYGAGDVAGIIVRDTIAFAGFNITADFGLATNVSDDFINFAIDGILGLGLSHGSQQGVPTILDALKESKQIDQKIYGIALSRAKDKLNDGVINFGGIDSSLFKGNITFTQSLISKGLWELPLQQLSIDDDSVDLKGTRSAVIDTGTSLMIIPPEDAMRLHAPIPGAVMQGETFVVPCATDAIIGLTFSNQTYYISPRDYVGDQIPSLSTGDDDLCVSLIDGRIILDDTTWLVGDVFLKNVYAVFNLETREVGFAAREEKPQKLVDEEDAAGSVRVGWLLAVLGLVAAICI